MGRWVMPENVRTWVTGATDEQVSSLIDLAEGQALAAAPELGTLSLSEDQRKAVRGILIAAIRRWWDAGSGAVSQRSEGPFSETLSSSAIVGQLYPSELRALSRIAAKGRVFSFSMDPAGGRVWPSWVINRPEVDGEE